MAGDDWIAQAREQLQNLSPGLQGEGRRQQAALALMQAAREGAELEELEQLLQSCVLRQLQKALTTLKG